jgi:crotonobetainyl-CoA:carnitine CoA-transferase CaiB-like acyl-CoA transferase
VQHPTEGTLRSTRSPFHLHGEPEQPDLPAPNISADARTVLGQAGFSVERIEALAAAGVIKL